MWAIATLICVGAFLQGLRFAKMTANPWTDKRMFGQTVEGSELPIEKVNRFGTWLMIAAPIFLLFFSALCFGVLGPVEGIQTITLH